MFSGNSVNGFIFLSTSSSFFFYLSVLPGRSEMKVALWSVNVAWNKWWCGSSARSCLHSAGWFLSAFHAEQSLCCSLNAAQLFFKAQPHQPPSSPSLHHMHILYTCIGYCRKPGSVQRWISTYRELAKCRGFESRSRHSTLVSPLERMKFSW